MKIDVLDAGYVEFIETWGSDERIIEAARMSTGKGFKGWGSDPCVDCGGVGFIPAEPYGPNDKRRCENCAGAGKVAGDEKLLAYLYNNRHATPFEMAGMVIEVNAPIFVFREWHRHRAQSYNEMSARYIPLPDENYLPAPENIRARILTGGGNKQAGSAVQHIPTDAEIYVWLSNLRDAFDASQKVYQDGLAIGIPKELARLPVPVARYSRMRASANLRNWLAFLTLRMSSNAQWEIREYANAVGEIVAEMFPRTWALFEQERANACA